ncbi:MAG: aminoglycoside adenylyltransferase domain-containing protein [Chloroflexia bacterium]
MAEAPDPTPYADVNLLLAMLRDGVRDILGPRFVGMYLYGSLAGGGFDSGSSDVDFLVVTEGEVPTDLLPALGEMHSRIGASGVPWSDHLEGSYIPRAALRRYDPANARHPSIGIDWPFEVGFHDATWVLNRYLIREHVVTVAGPPPATLIDPVGPDALRAAVRDVLATHWAEALHGPDWLRPRYYQAFAILTMCRALYLLETGRLVPKQVAAAWAREHLEPRWATLADRALAWRSDHAPDDMEETLAFIGYTVERAGPRRGIA